MKVAFYDFAVAPYSFDFCQFLVTAKSNDCERIVIVPGKRMVRDKLTGELVEFQKCTPGEQEYRLNNLILGLCPTAIVCQTRGEAETLWHKDCFPPGYTISTPKSAHTLGDVMKAGKIFPFLPTPEACKELQDDTWMRANMAVITIRDTHIKAGRNSNVAEWIKAADWLRAEAGLLPVFVPDTEKPDEAFGDHHVCRRAALEVQYRIALYEAATLNLGVNNGPMALNLLSRRPTLYFKPINPDYPESSEAGWKKASIPPGSQPPWFSPLQRIIWEGEDSFGNIKEAVETWQRAKAGDLTAWPASLAPTFPIRGVFGSEARGKQMAEALEAAKANGWPQMKRIKPGNEVLSVVCYGPSLADTWRDIKRPMLSVSGAHDFLIERGVVPDFHMDCDPRQHKAELVGKLHPEVQYLMATVCHPSFWERLKGHKVKLWHLHNGPETDEWLAKNDPGANRIGGGTTAGARALEIGSMLGYRRFEIHGMDCSFRGEHRHAGKHGGKKQNEIEVIVNGRPFRSSVQMVEAAREIVTFISNYDAELWFHGDGLQQTMVNAFKSRFGVIPPKSKQEVA